MIYKHLVIVGGGFTGSVAAIVGSQFAEKVTLIERYARETGQESIGTPQSHHVHIMLKKGQTLIEKLIPGILQELRDRGAKEVDWTENTSWDSPFGKFPNHHSGVKSLVFSRKLLDQILWARVHAIAKIHYRVDSLKNIELNRSAVKSLSLKSGEIISDADLYVDARGRTSKMREKLEAILGPIPQKVIPNRLRYTTTVIDRPYDPTEVIQQYYCRANATDTPLGYYASPIENDRVIFTAVDFCGNIAQPFRHLQSHPLLQGKAISATQTFSKLYSQHNLYGKAKYWPNNYAVIGDAVCKLNPVYGQGMTLGLEMIELWAKELRNKGRYRGHLFQKAVDALVAAAWSIVAMDEEGAHLGSLDRLQRRYMNALMRAALRDKSIHRTFLQVLHGMKSPRTFFSPIIMGRILASWAGS